MPPPLRQPEALNLRRTVASHDLFSPYDDLPIPDYLE